jgi:hypothetical protein
MSIFQGKAKPMPDIPMREFLERIIDERDRLYDSRFRAAEIAVNAALAAQQKAVAEAFLASEKAIIKAEEAQKEYNARSNEFRGQLDDQAKLLMQRSEALGLFSASDNKLETMRLFFDSKLESQRLAFEKNNENLVKEIGDLRESRSEIGGMKTGSREIIAYLIAAAGLALALVFHFVK